MTTIHWGGKGGVCLNMHRKPEIDYITFFCTAQCTS